MDTHLVRRRQNEYKNMGQISSKYIYKHTPFHLLMLFKTLVIFSILSFVVAVPQDKPDKFTVTRVFHTLTDVAPFIVDATTVFTFTPSPTTSLSFPTGPGA
ncbi:hypothetical protein C8R43DRAFT_1242322 [Mycena crocata]|nr:hypothetical protein C8R43DRAFT_1242322 [Mycena crocata]